jgi:Tfp pilus assembly protein FimT
MKNKIFFKNFNKGLSLIEILVVVAIFEILGIIVSSALVLTIQGTKKSESLVRVRENINYSLAVVERNLRNAISVPTCNGVAGPRIDYFDQDGIAAYFQCVNTGQPGSYIASGSAQVHLTPDTIKIMSCSFKCTPSSSGNPPFVTVSLTVQDASASGAQSSKVTSENNVYLRN